jgi:hypothetical protein
LSGSEQPDGAAGKTTITSAVILFALGVAYGIAVTDMPLQQNAGSGG